METLTNSVSTQLSDLALSDFRKRVLGKVIEQGDTIMKLLARFGMA